MGDLGTIFGTAVAASCPRMALLSPKARCLIPDGVGTPTIGEGTIMKAHKLVACGIGLGAAILVALPALAQSTKPHPQITITNQRTVPLESLEIATSGEQSRLVARLAKPLAPGKSVALKLNKPQGCSYYVLGKFADESEVDADGTDLCRDRVLRLTE
jgi:hypothetical protein